MQMSFLGRPRVVAGIAAGSTFLAVYFVVHYFTASTDERSVIELVIAGGCLLGALAGCFRAVELARQLRSVETTGTAVHDDRPWRVWVAGLIGLIAGGCVGFIGGVSFGWPRATVGAFAAGVSAFTGAICFGIFFAARRSRRIGRVPGGRP